MYKLRLREDRGKTLTDWLKSAHTFSFAQYFDPFNMGFSDLRVINDDIVAPSSGFEQHAHANMEIVTIVLEGAIEHRDSLGNETILNAGAIQAMTTGTGILHSEYNPSVNERAHILQIWVLPDRKNLSPEYSQKYFPEEEMKNELRLVVSKYGKKGSLKIHQDVLLYRSILEADKTIIYELSDNRKFWLQVARGAVEVNSTILEAGDGISFVDESGYLEISGVDLESDFLLFCLRNLTI